MKRFHTFSPQAVGNTGCAEDSPLPHTPLINTCSDQQTVVVPVSVLWSLSQDTVLNHTFPHMLIAFSHVSINTHVLV